MAQVNREERRQRRYERGTRRYEYVSRHPVRWAVTCGLLILAWVFLLSDGSASLAVAAGLGTFLLMWWAWRPHGFGHRLHDWAEQRYQRTEN